MHSQQRRFHFAIYSIIDFLIIIRSYYFNSTGSSNPVKFTFSARKCLEEATVNDNSGNRESDSTAGWFFKYNYLAQLRKTLKRTRFCTLKLTTNQNFRRRRFITISRSLSLLLSSSLSILVHLANGHNLKNVKALQYSERLGQKANTHAHKFFLLLSRCQGYSHFYFQPPKIGASLCFVFPFYDTQQDKKFIIKYAQKFRFNDALEKFIFQELNSTRGKETFICNAVHTTLNKII